MSISSNFLYLFDLLTVQLICM